MKAQTVKLVRTIEGRMIAETVAIDNLIPFMSVRGHELPDDFKVQGKFAPGQMRIEYREEIQGQPIFPGLLGPMYDGPGVVRYEDSESNDRLSV